MFSCLFEILFVPLSRKTTKANEKEMKKLFLTMMALVAVLAVKAQKTLVVAQDGTGDYSTIQAAVDAVSEGEEATGWNVY